jgi:hypothetical protein
VVVATRRERAQHLAEGAQHDVSRRQQAGLVEHVDLQRGACEHEEDDQERPLDALDLVERALVVPGEVGDRRAHHDGGEDGRHVQPQREARAEQHEAERLLQGGLAGADPAGEGRRGQAQREPERHRPAQLLERVELQTDIERTRLQEARGGNQQAEGDDADHVVYRDHALQHVDEAPPGAGLLHHGQGGRRRGGDRDARQGQRNLGAGPEQHQARAHDGRRGDRLHDRHPEDDPLQVLDVAVGELAPEQEADHHQGHGCRGGEPQVGVGREQVQGQRAGGQPQQHQQRHPRQRRAPRDRVGQQTGQQQGADRCDADADVIHGRAPQAAAARCVRP